MTTRLQTPADLVAIANAAHRQGDRRLLSAARRVLREQFGIRIVFDRRDKPAKAEAEAASDA